MELHMPFARPFKSRNLGYSAGTHKNAELVFDAFSSVHVDLKRIQVFHTDRGGEYNNQGSIKSEFIARWVT